MQRMKCIGLQQGETFFANIVYAYSKDSNDLQPTFISIVFILYCGFIIRSVNPSY